MLHAHAWTSESIGKVSPNWHPKFEKYLLGRPFTLHTDQHALRHIFASPSQAESKRKTSKFIHWGECLATYDFTLVYHPGKDNSVPNTLSRLPLVTTGEAPADG